MENLCMCHVYKVYIRIHTHTQHYPKVQGLWPWKNILGLSSIFNHFSMLTHKSHWLLLSCAQFAFPVYLVATCLGKIYNIYRAGARVMPPTNLWFKPHPMLIYLNFHNVLFIYNTNFYCNLIIYTNGSYAI